MRAFVWPVRQGKAGTVYRFQMGPFLGGTRNPQATIRRLCLRLDIDPDIVDIVEVENGPVSASM